MANFFLVLCASALFVQAISCACLGNGIATGISNIGLAGYGNGLGYGVGLGYDNVIGYGNGLGYGNNLYAGSFGNAGLGLEAVTGVSTPISGGGLAVSSVSPLAPSGLAVVSENEIGGVVSVSGVLPFLSAVALEGQVPSGGSAGVQYSCGNGNIGIVSENVGAGLGYGAGVGYGNGLGYGAGLGYGTGLGYGAGLGLGSCGCSGIY